MSDMARHVRLEAFNKRPNVLTAPKLAGRNTRPVGPAPNANVLIQTPTQALRPFVKRFVIAEFPFDRKLKLLPDTSFVAEFRFKGDYALDGRANLPREVISGLWDTARTRIYPGGTSILLAVFTEIGAITFLRYPPDTLLNTTMAMEKVLNRASGLAPLGEQLAAAENHGRRVQIAESFLLERVRNARPDSLVSAAVSCIEETQAGIRIEELARRVGLSQSALERRFRRNVGTSPKHLASVFRLKNAIRLRAAGHDFTSIAHSAGYSDQSHFINDFKRATGLAPSAFFQESTLCKGAEFLQVAFAA
jgi:AraC-like DNA-binding protein